MEQCPHHHLQDGKHSCFVASGSGGSSRCSGSSGSSSGSGTVVQLSGKNLTLTQYLSFSLLFGPPSHYPQ